MKCSVSWCSDQATVQRKGDIRLGKGVDRNDISELCPTHLPKWRVEEFEPLGSVRAEPKGRAKR